MTETKTGSDEPNDEATGDSGDNASDEPDDSTSDEPDDSASGEMERDESSWRERMSASQEMQRQEDAKMVWLLVACAAVLIVGIVFAAKFRKKG